MFHEYNGRGRNSLNVAEFEVMQFIYGEDTNGRFRLSDSITSV